MTLFSKSKVFKIRDSNDFSYIIFMIYREEWININNLSFNELSFFFVYQNVCLFIYFIISV